jgi:enoyl-CoA hydratase/carnithine racemase
MTSNTTTQTEAPLLTATRDGVATLTLNRPGQFNALSSALIDELQSTFDRLAADPTVSVVVLAANGRGFCAGHDLKEIRAMGSVPEVESLFARCSRMMMTITALPQPVIARVHGIATAAGCQLVATCDLAVASTAATFATPGVKHRRVLFHPQCRARPGGRPQTRHGDAAHRRDSRRRACLRDRTHQSRRVARGA